MSAFHIGPDGGQGMIQDVAYTDGCGQVHHHVTLSDKPPHHICIQHAALDKLETRVIERPAQVLNPAGA